MEKHFTAGTTAGRHTTRPARHLEKTTSGAALSRENDLDEWLEAESEVLERERGVREETEIRRQAAPQRRRKDPPRAAIPVEGRRIP